MSSRTINFIMIISGGLMALLSKSEDPNGQYVMIGGAVLLMIGLYRVSRNISNRSETVKKEEPFIIDEEFDDSVDLKEESRELDESKKDE